MPNPRVPLGLTAAAIGAFLCATFARARPAGAQGVTIRGTGSNITIERAPVQPQRGETSPPELTVYGPIAQAVRMKQAGASDEQILEFLRAHAEELPSIIEVSDVERLRAAGLGKSAILRLTELAGVDIGLSWSGERAPQSPTVYLEPSVEPFGGGVYGYPAYAGFVPAPPRRRFLPHVGRRPGSFSPVPPQRFRRSTSPPGPRRPFRE